MNKFVCNKCGTENEDSYVYCKNCGFPLPNNSAKFSNTPDSAEFSSEDHQNQYQQSGVYTNQNGYLPDSVDGIPNQEIALFIGKKASSIIPKFTKMELTDSKISWCWPLAVLTFFFGPFGASFWFFYRKMYKPAAVFSIIGAAVSIITALLTSIIDTSFVDSIMNSYMEGDFQAVITAVEGIDFTSLILFFVAGLIGNIANISSFIVCGIFGFYWYKQHCLDKIRYYRSIQADQRFYRLGLSAIGGVSGGMVTLGIVIMIIVNYLTEFLTTIFSMI